VATLAGYLRASNGNMLAFAIMNNGVSTSTVGRNFQDKVCQALAK
jgi:D-alanyl-D-alanine carboxypeptidase/D-alanyl-D-alanine-endopeptidase (penicillin-binding protein 4)